RGPRARRHPHGPFGVIHSAGALRREPAGPDHRRAGLGRDHGPGAPHRGRARRRHPRRPDPDGHAVRPQPDRRLALARRTRRAGRLRSRRARARPGPRGPSGPPVTASTTVTRRRWLADLAWLPGQGVCRDVLIEADGDRFTAVTPGATSAATPQTSSATSVTSA